MILLPHTNCESNNAYHYNEIAIYSHKTELVYIVMSSCRAVVDDVGDHVLLEQSVL